jgi:hypothetical protein
MNLRALYVSKLAKCPLTCLADLAGDQNANQNQRDMPLHAILGVLRSTFHVLSDLDLGLLRAGVVLCVLG